MSEINEIGSRFDRALSVLQVSNKEISELFDTSSQNVSNLKKADRLNDLMSRIAIKYDINLNWLMSGSGDMFVQKDTFTQHVSINNGNNALNNFAKQSINNDKIKEFDEDVKDILKKAAACINQNNKESFVNHVKSWIVDNL